MKKKKSFLEFNNLIEEARRKGYEAASRKPLRTPIEILNQYKDDPNVMISFAGDAIPRGDSPSTRKSEFLHIVGSNPTMTKRFGLNTMASHGDPIGIYGYPLKEFWGSIEKYNIPYRSDFPYVWVFKPKRPERVLFISKYTDISLEQDINELIDLLGPKKWGREKIQSIIDDLDPSYKDEPAKIFWSILRSISFRVSDTDPRYPKATAVWSRLFSRFYDGVVDDIGSKTIHSNEPYQCVFWNNALINVIDVIDRKHREREKSNRKLTKKAKQNDPIDYARRFYDRLRHYNFGLQEWSKRYYDPIEERDELGRPVYIRDKNGDEVIRSYYKDTNNVLEELSLKMDYRTSGSGEERNITYSYDEKTGDVIRITTKTKSIDDGEISSTEETIEDFSNPNKDTNTTIYRKMKDDGNLKSIRTIRNVSYKNSQKRLTYEKDFILKSSTWKGKPLVRVTVNGTNSKGKTFYKTHEKVGDVFVSYESSTDKTTYSLIKDSDTGKIKERTKSILTDDGENFKYYTKERYNNITQTLEVVDKTTTDSNGVVSKFKQEFGPSRKTITTETRTPTKDGDYDEKVVSKIYYRDPGSKTYDILNNENISTTTHTTISKDGIDGIKKIKKTNVKINKDFTTYEYEINLSYPDGASWEKSLKSWRTEGDSEEPINYEETLTNNIRKDNRIYLKTFNRFNPNEKFVLRSYRIKETLADHYYPSYVDRYSEERDAQGRINSKIVKKATDKHGNKYNKTMFWDHIVPLLTIRIEYDVIKKIPPYLLKWLPKGIPNINKINSGTAIIEYRHNKIYQTKLDFSGPDMFRFKLKTQGDKRTMLYRVGENTSFRLEDDPKNNVYKKDINRQISEKQLKKYLIKPIKLFPEDTYYSEAQYTKKSPKPDSFIIRSYNIGIIFAELSNGTIIQWDNTGNNLSAIKVPDGTVYNAEEINKLYNTVEGWEKIFSHINRTHVYSDFAYNILAMLWNASNKAFVEKKDAEDSDYW